LGPARFVFISRDRVGVARPHDEFGPTSIRTVETVYDTEGLGIAIVIIAGDLPYDELRAVLVHPSLHAVPIIVFAPGRPVPDGICGNVLRVVNEAVDPLSVLVQSIDTFVPPTATPA
jgi:hypothetical protein